MSLALCKTCTELGLLLLKNDILRWTPAHLQEQWNLILEALADKKPVKAQGLVVATSLSPKKKTARKRKTLTGAPGDAEKASEIDLTIAQCIKMEEPEIRKLSPKSLKVMRSLYTSVFDPLYIWGKKPLADVFGKPHRVHFEYLH